MGLAGRCSASSSRSARPVVRFPGATSLGRGIGRRIVAAVGDRSGERPPCDGAFGFAECARPSRSDRSVPVSRSRGGGRPGPREDAIEVGGVEGPGPRSPLAFPPSSPAVASHRCRPRRRRVVALGRTRPRFRRPPDRRDRRLDPQGSRAPAALPVSARDRAPRIPKSRSAVRSRAPGRRGRSTAQAPESPGGLTRGHSLPRGCGRSTRERAGAQPRGGPRLPEVVRTPGRSTMSASENRSTRDPRRRGSSSETTGTLGSEGRPQLEWCALRSRHPDRPPGRSLAGYETGQCATRPVFRPIERASPGHGGPRRPRRRRPVRRRRRPPATHGSLIGNRRTAPRPDPHSADPGAGEIPSSAASSVAATPPTPLTGDGPPATSRTLGAETEARAPSWPTTRRPSKGGTPGPIRRSAEEWPRSDGRAALRVGAQAGGDRSAASPADCRREKSR